MAKISVLITCAKSSGMSGRFCPTIEDHVPLADVDDWYRRQMSEHAWTEHDGETYCPRHNPADEGAIAMFTSEMYLPIGDSGWEARAPHGQYDVSLVRLEIRQRREGADA